MGEITLGYIELLVVLLLPFGSVAVMSAIDYFDERKQRNTNLEQ